MQNNQFDFELFFNGYVTAALWSSTDDEGNPLDDAYVKDDIHPAALGTMRKDCRDFMESNKDDLMAYKNERASEESAGIDFWLTRNGHGAGFWDRGLGALGARLTKASKPYSNCDLYVGDDGMIHI